MGGGSMLRTMGSAIAGGGARDVLSSTVGVRPGKPLRIVSVPLSSSLPLLSASGAAAGGGDRSVSGCAEHLVFGPVPSKEEVEEAVSTLQRIFVPVTFSQFTEDKVTSLEKDAFDKMLSSTKIMHSVSSAKPELDWTEPTMQLHSSKVSQPEGQNKVIHAFRLLQLNPSVQRAVVSLSSDKAVWDAVMKNEVVQELKESFYAARSSKPQSSDVDPDPDVAIKIIRWILENSKAKIMELIDKITGLVNELFHSRERDKKDIFDDVLRSSFMLSVMVFIVVIVARFQSA